MVVDRSRHPRPPLRNGLEADPAVIGLVADQHHEPMSAGFGVLQRAVQQRAANPAAAKRWLYRQRPQQQSRRIADADRQLAHRTNQQRPDPGGERKLEQVIDMLANPVSAQHEAAGPERTLMQPLDGLGVVGAFGQYGERKVAHGLLFIAGWDK